MMLNKNKFIIKFFAFIVINFSSFAVDQDYQPILAEEIVGQDDKYCFLDINTEFDYLLEKNGNKLFCKNIQDNYNQISSIEIPKIENKNFFDAKVITKRFISLIFNDEDLLIQDFNHIPYDTKRIIKNYYQNPEYFIWDLESGDKPNLFKIENPDFIRLQISSLSKKNNQDCILVHEVYKKNVDDDDLLNGKGLYRYRFYNLFERKFDDKFLFSSYNFCVFYNQKIFENDITPKYALKYDNENILIHNAFKNDKGDFEIGEKIYTISQKNLYELYVKEEKLLFYKQEKGYYVPFLFDLAKGEELCLLDEDELKNIKSDIYNTFITKTNDVLIYFTHSDERKLHTKIMPLFKNDEKSLRRKKLMDEVFQEIGTLELDSRLLPLFLEDENNFQGKSQKLFNLFEVNKDLFESKKYEAIMKQFQVSDYLYNKHKLQHLKKRLIPLKGAVLKTADQKFDMPIYYAKHAKPNNWCMIEIHGGPHARDFNEVDFVQQFWSSRGFSYVVTNIRGSNGFGEEYKKASEGKWYEVVDDVKQVIDWAKANGLGENIIVKGGSFGGYASAASFAKGYADNIIAINGLYDLEQDISDVKAGKTKYSKDDCSYQILEFGDTEEIRKENSVNTHLKYNPNGNMLIIAGLDDDNCLPIQSQNLFKQMKELGNNANLLTIEGEGHLINKKPENRLMVLKVQEAFVAKITGFEYLDQTGYQLINQTEGLKLLDSGIENP